LGWLVDLSFLEEILAFGREYFALLR